MDKLHRLSGATFSTSGKRWFPFRGNPKIAKHNAKLHRMIKAGKLQPMTKAEQRQACEQATQRKRR